MEGEEGDSAFLVADCDVEVLRNVRGAGSTLLATLGPGSLVGTGSLILGGGRRSASCVSTGRGWVYEMDHATHEALSGQVARAWKEALMGELRDQILFANRILVELAMTEDGA